MIVGLQIIGILFSLFMIYFALLHYKKGALNRVEIGSWVITWFAVIVMVIFPNVVRKYAEGFAISRLLDLMIGGALILVFLMVGSAYIRVNKLEKKLEDLVRKLALKEKK